MFNQPKENDVRDIALYTRVSTDEQAREGLSLDEQYSRLKSYLHALEITQPIRHYKDEGYSAKDLNRPQMNALLEAVKSDQISKVIVTKLDRFSRKLKDLLDMIETFTEHNVAFISISESFDTNTPSGRLTLQVLGAVAEFERERIRERVIDNMFHAAQKGQWLTQAPYGYSLVDKCLQVNKEEAPIVKRIFHLYLEEHLGLFAIAKLLNEEGIPTRSGKAWWNRTIKLILTNPVYKGTTIWNRVNGASKKREIKDVEKWIIQENTHEAIISSELWEQAQEKMNERKLPPRSQRSTYLLSGLLKCGQCGGGMSHDTAGPKGKKYGVYRCSANKNRGSCTSKVYRAKELEQLVKESLHTLSKELSLGATYTPAIIQKPDTVTSTTIQQKIQTAKKRYKRKVEAYTAGFIELTDLEIEKKQLDQLLEELDNQETNEFDIEKIEKEMKDRIRNVADALDELPVPEAKRLLKEVIKKIVVYSDKLINIHLI
ncbi:MAG: recombinase family protein [Bacillaceae bacterium]